jgi:hypothetical protein
MKKLINLLLVITGLLLFIGCTSSEPSLPDTPSFKQGQKDGCATATGNYVKDNHAFKTDRDYQNGWFYGRKSCNPSQAQS